MKPRFFYFWLFFFFSFPLKTLVPVYTVPLWGCWEFQCKLFPDRVIQPQVLVLGVSYFLKTLCNESSFSPAGGQQLCVPKEVNRKWWHKINVHWHNCLMKSVSPPQAYVCSTLLESSYLTPRDLGEPFSGRFTFHIYYLPSSPDVPPHFSKLIS